eukprot:RCo029031
MALLADSRAASASASGEGPTETISLQQLYIKACEEMRCKKNSFLLGVLPSTPGDFGRLTELDLSLNFVGRVGLRAVLLVVQRAPALTRLCLADNWLNNDSVKELVAAVSGMPQLRHLDLSRNPISHAAGKLLSELVTRTPSLVYLGLEGTLIGPAVLREIAARLQANAAGL